MTIILSCIIIAYTVVASNAWNSMSLLSENTPSLSPAATTSTEMVYITSSSGALSCLSSMHVSNDINFVIRYDQTWPLSQAQIFS